jgi:hypothetical protein
MNYHGMINMWWDRQTVLLVIHCKLFCDFTKPAIRALNEIFGNTSFDEEIDLPNDNEVYAIEAELPDMNGEFSIPKFDAS